MANLNSLLRVGFLSAGLLAFAETYELKREMLAYPDIREYESLYGAFSFISALFALTTSLVIDQREHHNHDGHGFCCHYH